MTTKATSIPVGSGGPAYFPPLPMPGMQGRRFAFLAPDNGGGAGGGGAQGNQGGQQQQGQQGQQGGQQQQQQGPYLTFQTQDDFDKVINQRIGREHRRFQELEDKYNQLQQQIQGGQGAQGQQQAQQGQQGNAGKTYSQSEVEALIAQDYAPKLEAANKRIEQLQGVQRDNAILKAAANAYSPEQVVQLLKSEITVDNDGNLVVVDDKGNPRLNPTTGKPISVEQHVATYLEANKHLVKGSGVPGVGSSNRNASGNGNGGTTGQRTWASATDALARALGGPQ